MASAVYRECDSCLSILPSLQSGAFVFFLGGLMDSAGLILLWYAFPHSKHPGIAQWLREKTSDEGYFYPFWAFPAGCLSLVGERDQRSYRQKRCRVELALLVRIWTLKMGLNVSFLITARMRGWGSGGRLRRDQRPPAWAARLVRDRVPG